MFSVELLSTIRAWEFERIVRCFRLGARILEIGAGTGQQALALSQRGYAVETIDLADSEYAKSRVYNVTEYDGSTIPFSDHSFDFVFSSNVLEHVADLPRMHSEIARVLKPDGRAVHVLPTPAWRFWTTLTTFPTALQYILKLRTEVFPRRPFNRCELVRVRQVWGLVGHRIWWAVAQGPHGIRGNVISEVWLYRAGFWRRNFTANGFQVECEYPIGLFYTGALVMGRTLSMQQRARLAKLLGSACRIFVLKLSRHSTLGAEVESDCDAEPAAAV
jgi:SAM-dependent methyltransferase